MLTDYEISCLKEAINSSPLLVNKENSDNVNHPQHYISKNGIETIDVIKEWTDGLDGIVAVDTANIIKYISRWNKKNGIEDLKKAQWYLNHLIKEVEG
jgi:tRNA (Thr-GGU) A37 N-methylase